MTAVYQVQVTLPYTSGLPEDVSVNDFTVTVDDPATADFAGIQAAFVDFYNGADTGDQPISEWLGSILSREVDAAKVQFKNVDLATGHITPASAPLTFTLGPRGTGVSANMLPLEMAICVSWSADPFGTATTGRRRGRNYIGPFSISCITNGSDSVPHPVDPLIVSLVDSQKRLCVALDALDPSVSLRIWSRANHDTVAVASGWVDNELDTQRRRGSKPTTRASFTFP